MDAHGSLDWWSHSVSGFEKIPGPSQSSLVKHYTEEEKVSFLLVLGTRPITKEVQNRLGVWSAHSPVQVSNVPIWQLDSCAWMVRWR